MKTKMMAVVSLIFGFMLAGVTVNADQVNYASGQSSSQLLQLPLGAKAVAQGEAMACSSTGVESLVWNPAGLLSGRQHQAFTDYLALPGGINIASAGYAYNDSWWGAGLWFSYANYGVIERFDLTVNGFPTEAGETFTPSSMLTILGLAGKVSEGLIIGLTGKLLYEDMVETKWNVLSTDIGARIDTAFSNLKAGLMVKNIGQDVDHYAPPLLVQTGFTWDTMLGIFDQDNLAISVDGVLTEAQPVQLAVGLAYDLEEMFTVRLGYRSSELQHDKEFISGFSAGFSFRFKDYALHYAFTPDVVLGASHRISLEAAFGKVFGNKKTDEQQNRQQGNQYLLKYLK